MKVWWCEEHKHPSDDAEQCYETDWIPCRMVEMQLVPADALVIEKAVQLIAQDGSVAWEASIKEEES